MELRKESFFRERLLRSLGNSKINDFDHGVGIMQRDEHVGRLDITMNNPFLMRMLDSVTDAHEELQSLGDRDIVLVAEFSDRNALNQFHYEIRPAGLSGTAVENLCNIRMVHHGQGLSLRLETGHNFFGVHAELNHLERHPATDWFLLLGHIDRDRKS